MFQIRKHKEKVTTPPSILLENRQTSNPYSLLKAGGDPAMINQDHFFHFFVTTNKASNNKTTNFKFENVSFTKLRKKG